MESVPNGTCGDMESTAMDYHLIKSLEDLKILLVDDDSFMHRLLETVLIDLGFKQIVKAEDGQQALGILKNNHIDLLLTDIRMPNMNGLELLRQVRCGNTGVSNNLRSIIITSFSNVDTLGTAIALDVNGFLDKPFKPVTVIKKILFALSEDEQSQRPGSDYEDIVTDLKSLAVSSHTEAVEAGDSDTVTTGRAVSAHMLQPGMKLVDEIRTDDGTLLLPEGFLLTRQSIHRIHELNDVLQKQEFGVDPVW